MKRQSALMLALLSAVALLGGCATTPPGPRYVEVVRVPPPAPYVEYVGAPPVVGHIWISGYWNWGGARYVWVPGRWEAPRPGYAWVPHRWEREGDHWRPQGGHWERGGRAAEAQTAPRQESRERDRWERRDSPRSDYREPARPESREPARVVQRDVFEPERTERAVAPEFDRSRGRGWGRGERDAARAAEATPPVVRSESRTVLARNEEPRASEVRPVPERRQEARIDERGRGERMAERRNEQPADRGERKAERKAEKGGEKAGDRTGERGDRRNDDRR